MENYLKQRGITLTFNPPAASHEGGSWERQIRSIRQIFSIVLHSQQVSDNELSTLLAKVEGILNSRPSVPIVFDPEGNKPLTSNHLFLLRGNTNLSPGLFEKRNSYAKRRWAQV